MLSSARGCHGRALEKPCLAVEENVWRTSILLAGGNISDEATTVSGHVYIDVMRYPYAVCSQFRLQAPLTIGFW